MRHFIRLGLRGYFLEVGSLLMRAPGRLYYRWLLLRNRFRSR